MLVLFYLMKSPYRFVDKLCFTLTLLTYTGADVKACDKDGNTPLHVAQMASPVADQVNTFT